MQILLLPTRLWIVLFIIMFSKPDIELQLAASKIQLEILSIK